MYVLGVSCYYHDASAALIKDGRVVAASEEERFTRKKHDTGFPGSAIADCLRQARIGISDVDYVAFYEKPFMKFERVLYQHLDGFPWTLKTFLSSMPSWVNEKLRVMRAIRKLGFKGDVLFVPHHLAHAASAFYFSPFQKAAILTVDGVGEWSTTTFGIGQGDDIRLMKEIRFPHSLGLLYSTITAYLGFTVNNSEYKVMGLAPYGTMDRSRNPYYSRMRKVIDIKDDGSFRLDMEYFIFHRKDRMPSKKLCELLGGPVREGETAIDERHKDIAAALQLVFEDVMTLMIRHVHKVTGCDELVMAGGVALNSVYNGKILRETPFRRVWIQPNASDGGTSLGVAAYAYTSILGKRRVAPLEDAYLGPGFSRKEIKSFLKKNRIKHRECRTDGQLIKEVSGMLAGNMVIGWFQGRMEWGPRALGARSILSNPCEKNMQEILNLKVKHREKFRPFAPVVCVDDATKYFECDEPVPEPADYMLMVYPVRKEYRETIPSVTHVDGSGRLQTVRREQNRLYHDLIKEFGRITGVPILINTSFNIRGEPIVCTPFDAYKCMMGTGIDCLVMDRFIIRREDNPRDMWDSETLAKD